MTSVSCCWCCWWLLSCTYSCTKKEGRKFKLAPLYACVSVLQFRVNNWVIIALHVRLSSLACITKLYLQITVLHLHTSDQMAGQCECWCQCSVVEYRYVGHCRYFGHCWAVVQNSSRCRQVWRQFDVVAAAADWDIDRCCTNSANSSNRTINDM